MKVQRYTTSHGTMCDAAEVADLESKYAELEAKCAQLDAKCAELTAAAKDVIIRWDSPMWRMNEHTADFINKLREAVAKCEG